MNVSVFGAYPGNVFDMTPYVHLSDYNDTFTSADAYMYCRTIQIATTGRLPSFTGHCVRPASNPLPS